MNEVITAEEAQIVQPVPAVSGGDSRTLMALIERLATAEKCDLDRIEKLLELKERWEAAEARKAYVAAMARFKVDAPKLFKDKHVSYTTSKGLTEYDHATLGAVCAAVIDGLAKQGISHGWEYAQSTNEVKVTCVLTHEFGHAERTTLHAAHDDSGGKNSIQGLGSAITYLERYTLLGATGLAAMEDSDGRDAGNPAAASEPAETSWPEGYKAFRERIPAVAKKGTRELRKSWEATEERLRTFATAKDLNWWNEQKKAAETADAAALVKR